MKKEEIVVIIGSSGSGKSTFLHILAGLDCPTSGNIIFNGKYINNLSDNKRAFIRNKELGFIYQFHHLLNDFTSLENVAIPLLIGKNTKKISLKKAEKMLEIVGMSHRLNHRPSEMSGGECQRIAIARALINEPILVLADEPTGNLDSINRESIFNLLKMFNNIKKTAILIVTHDRFILNNIQNKFEMKYGCLHKINFL